MSTPLIETKPWPIHLLFWYEKHKRSFPWRENTSCDLHTRVFHTWICEIMSQQTLISVVLPKFEKFIATLAHVHALAHCSEDTLRQLWSGLGYYARARNLQKGAQYILEKHKGLFPSTMKEWLLVPGCGPYTASIIASVCFNEAVGAVDGNVIRVVSRLLNLQHGVWEKSGQEKIQQFVNRFIPDDNPGDFNQAMMDLGATVCKKQNPTCEICPLNTVCLAFQKNTVSLCPPVKPRRQMIDENLYALVFYNDQKKYLVIKRGKGFLSKTTGFPLLKETDTDALSTLHTTAKSHNWQVSVLPSAVQHTITHHKINARAMLIQCPNSFFDSKNVFFKNLPHDQLVWVEKSALKENLSSSLDQKVKNLLS